MTNLKSYNPTTPSLRQAILSNRESLWKKSPYKQLTKSKKKSSGRNNSGKITVRHKSRGHKKQIRILDIKRQKLDVFAIVERIEYDPYRSSHIALIRYSDGQYSYIIAPAGIKIGSQVVSSIYNSVEIAAGNSTILSKMPLGSFVHNIESKPRSGGAIARAAGSSAQIIGRNSGYSTLRMQSGEIKNIPSNCMATYGSVSNADHKNEILGKAGRSRWKGIRPTVRGVAMNPIDHPHGGGEGRTSGGRHPVSPTGRVVKGQKTRKKNKKSSFSIIKQRKNSR